MRQGRRSPRFATISISSMFITRAQDEQRVSLSTLRALQLPLPNGRTVPLSQVASFDFEQEFPLIWRRQRVPT